MSVGVVGGAVLLAAAAAFTIHRRRSRHSRRRRMSRSSSGKGSGGTEPLLPLSGSDCGGGSALLPITKIGDGDGDGNGSTGTEDVAAQRLRLCEAAQFDPMTGFPANRAAEQLAALNWRMGPTPESDEAGSACVVSLPFAVLVQGTRNFDAAGALGTGGSCDVFKGTVFGLTVAVKRLNAGGSDWAERQFTAEMQLLTMVAHPNVVALFAFSTDGPNRCLVLELCTGGALNDRLSCKAQAGSPPPPPLRWQQRVQIALGILQALEFLHGLTPQMIHRQECSDDSHSAPVLSQHTTQPDFSILPSSHR
jgi:hypothetical protein